MGKRQKSATPRPQQRATATASARSERRERIARRKDEHAPTKSGWLRGKRPILRFVLIFGLCMAVFYFVTGMSLFRDTIFPAYLSLNARASVWIMNCMGEGATAREGAVLSPRFSIEIARGCDAVEPAALFVSAVLASPVVLGKRLLGMAVGTALLMLLNLVRIVTLFYVGVYYPKAFHVMHIDVWQALFIFLALLFWVLWARWAKRIGTVQADASN